MKLWFLNDFFLKSQLKAATTSSTKLLFDFHGDSSNGYFDVGIVIFKVVF